MSFKMMTLVTITLVGYLIIHCFLIYSVEWVQYFQFSNYSNPKHEDVKCKVTQIIEHQNDHFFLSEMTGDKNDTITSLIKL